MAGFTILMDYLTNSKFKKAGSGERNILCKGFHAKLHKEQSGKGH
jgi:hypothetical protein